MKQYREYLKYEFTDVEITDFAKELANANRKRASIEQRKKEIDADLKAKIEEQNSLIGRLSETITTGHEYRDIDCRMELDTPEKGKKRIVRLDTGEEVRVIYMTEEDRQMVLKLEEEANAADASNEEQKDEVIVTPTPQVLQIDGPTVISGATLAQAAVMGGTHAKRERKPRNPEAEGFVDGSVE